jgi:Flp pilus assembly protein TadG
MARLVLAPLIDRLRARTRGQVLVIFALAIVVLLVMAGIAIDAGRFYSEKRFLQNSADAAALAAANRLIAGGSNADAVTAANEVLTRNYLNAPNGITPDLPANPPIYTSGHSGEPSYLLEGILITGSDVRVSIHSHIPYTFGRIVGFQENVIYGQARAAWTGNMLPVAVRQFVNAPGDGSGSYICNQNQSQFMDFFATADTSCLGTETDDALRVEPTADPAFNTLNPGFDSGAHGPIVAILGQGAQPSNGSDFRGFIALDIRNFATSTSQLYYNEVTASTNSTTLKDMEAGWILAGGYPGPMFPAATSPPDANNQVGIMSGNSTGIAIDAVLARFAPGDEVLVAVYPGQTMAIPDFSLSSPGTINLPTSGTTANAGSFKVSRNQAFSGTVDQSTVADAGDPANPMVIGTLVGADPITYTPDPVTPSLGSGQTVTMTNVTTSGATEGIYTLWVKGQAGSPYLTTKYTPFPIKVGTVSRDFTITADSSEQTAANAGDTVTFTLNLKRSGSSWGSTVALTLEAMPGGTLPTGLGAVTFSPSSVTPTAGGGVNSILTIGTGTVAPGRHEVVVRATGMNTDSPAHQVTHLLPLVVNVGTASSGGNQEYVDIVGFAVMRIASLGTNTIDAYAITPVIADPADERLRRGQVAKLVPWT